MHPVIFVKGHARPQECIAARARTVFLAHRWDVVPIIPPHSVRAIDKCILI